MILFDISHWDLGILFSQKASESCKQRSFGDLRWNAAHWLQRRWNIERSWPSVAFDIPLCTRISGLIWCKNFKKYFQRITGPVFVIWAHLKAWMWTFQSTYLGSSPPLSSNFPSQKQKKRCKFLRKEFFKSSRCCLNACIMAMSELRGTE